jgi:archaetidylinositol phosphate synthase
MIDGLFKRHIDPMWENLARPLAASGLRPNDVTLFGLCLVAANAAAYVWHGSHLVFGIGLAVSFAADSLDGAVARLRRECTLFGGYLDAMVDRYQETIVLLAIAYVNDAWLPASLALAGSLLTSYAKARVAIEVPVVNDDWPDLFERQERVVFLCGLLVVSGVVSALVDMALITPGLWLFAFLTHFTVLQRMIRAGRKLLAWQDEVQPRRKGL